MLQSPDQVASTRPYLLRALYEWCTDNGFTPYIAVYVDDTVRVPMEYVKNNEIVLNIGFDATSGLVIGNELLEFKARFAGTARDISVPIDRVVAIYARENGQGMAFPVPQAVPQSAPPRVPLAVDAGASAPTDPNIPSDTASGKPQAVVAPISKSKPRPGLRLAGLEPEPTDDAKPQTESPAELPPDEPPPSKAPPSGSRKPALKRVK